MSKLTGRCMCGTIAYEITGKLGPIYNCHCAQCRRWHNAAFRTRASLAKSQFKWTKGEEALGSCYSSDKAIKTFCTICGANLISLLEDSPNMIGLPIGGLEQDPGRRPEGHIFVKYKAPWYEITDNLPQFEEWPPGAADAVRNSMK